MISLDGTGSDTTVFVVLVASAAAAVGAVAAESGIEAHRLVIVGALSRNMARRLKLRPGRVQRV